MRTNPFNVSFGKKPLQLLSRENIVQEIVDVFENENPETESLILTGPRGCGKTVLLSEIKEHFDGDVNWITADLNACMEMHEQLAARLYQSGKIKKLFLKVDFSFSFHGITFSLEGNNAVNDIYSLLSKMLEYIKRKGIKVLITIDDINKNEFIKAFAHTYQSFLREGFPVFLLGTGIYSNISSLSSDKAVTFLLRTPKIMVESLNIRAIAISYKNIFGIPIEKAARIAECTKGYAYAYQLLGNLLFKHNLADINETIMDEYDIALEDRAYAQMWKELTRKEKLIISTLANNDEIKNADLAQKCGMKPNALEVYKKTLSMTGLVDTSERGRMRFSLPRFKEFVIFKTIIEE